MKKSMIDKLDDKTWSSLLTDVRHLSSSANRLKANMQIFDNKRPMSDLDCSDFMRDLNTAYLYSNSLMQFFTDIQFKIQQF